MNFESRAIVMEDIGRQILANNKHVPPATLCAQVDAITAEDLQRVAGAMLKTPVTISGHGDTSKIAKLSAVQNVSRAHHRARTRARTRRTPERTTVRRAPTRTALLEADLHHQLPDSFGRLTGVRFGLN